MTFDSGFIALRAIVADVTPSHANDLKRNEAQTRFDVIDRILRDVLDWPAGQIRVESHVANQGYTDYELVDPFALAIVEAKREGASFILPDDSPSGVSLLAPLVRDASNVALRAALIQLMQYASHRGVAPGIVTNGHQWVAFLASRNDGVAPLEGKALIFPSLESMVSNFVTLYGSLSHGALHSRRLFSTLSVGTAAPPAPLSASLHGYPGIKHRNTVQSNLQIMGQIMLEDMPQEEKYSELFLRECYATSGALSSYAEISRELLTSRNAAMLQDLGATEHPAATKRGVSPALSEESLAAAAAKRPIVLLGGVGAGKSTFIQHLVRVDARLVFADAIAITVDYGRGATFIGPSEYAVGEIRTQLLEDHGIDVDEASFVEDLYRRDLDRFDRGVFGRLKDVDPQGYALKRIDYLAELVAKTDEHLRRAIERIVRNRRRQVVVFLDNVDQRDLETQNQVFITANELASRWEATVFVTLRPETYYESQRYGAVSGYHPRVFAIAPPRVDVMLQKRVDFALRVLENGGDARTAASTGLGFESENLELFLRVLEVNFSRNRTLLALIENLAGGNMRRALDFVTQFIGSGHVDTDKIIGVERREPGQYMIPLHEFLRSLMYGDGQHYDPQTSVIPNLFSVDRPGGQGHFLLPFCLDYILARGEAQDSAGFVDLDEVYRQMQSKGYPPDATAFALDYAGRFRLVEAPLSDFEVSQVNRARITTVGAYSLRNLPKLFTYCDAVVVDTPIFDPDVRSGVRDAHSLLERVERVELLQSYLDECWRAVEVGQTDWDWPATSRELTKDLRGVRRRGGLGDARAG